MKFPQRRQFLHLAAGAAALPAVSPVANAQTYPSRPITIVVPYAAGGLLIFSGASSPRVSRRRLHSLSSSKTWEERPGILESGEGTAGDGYTLSIGDTSTHVVNGAIYTLPYDSLKDFEPIALLSRGTVIIVAKKGPAGERSEELYWLVEGEPGESNAGNRRCGQPDARRRRSFAEPV